MTDVTSRAMGNELRPNLMARAITEATLEHASEFHLLADPRGEALWVAPAVTSVLGYQVEEFLAMPAWSLVHPDDVERVRRVHAELALDEGGRRRAQYRCRHADDSWRWVEVVSSNLLTRPGVEGIVTTMRDVTSRVIAKRRLSQSERQLRSIVSSAGDIIAILDDRGQIEYITPTVAALLQRSAREVSESWGDFVHPDDLDSLAELFKEALEDPGVTQGPVDMRLLGGDGEWVTVEALFTDYRTDPIVRGIVLNARDVTERRRIEASERNNQRIFNTLVEMAPVGIFLTDARGDWTYVNNRITADFGVAGSAMLGGGWKDRFDAADVVRRPVVAREDDERVLGDG